MTRPIPGLESEEGVKISPQPAGPDPPDRDFDTNDRAIRMNEERETESGGGSSVAWLDARPVFPPSHRARADGLIAAGGDLSVDRLLAAYRRGIFPWYGPDDPILWWSPDPRAIFEFDRFYLSRRLIRTIRSGKFRLTINQAFADLEAGRNARGVILFEH